MYQKGKPPSSDNEIFGEVETSEFILNLDYYLHKALTEAITAIGAGIKKGAPKEGILHLSISTDIAKGIAEAKQIFDPTNEDYKNRREEYRKSINITDDYRQDLIQNAHMAKFDLIEIMKVINEHGTKHGKVIM